MLDGKTIVVTGCSSGIGDRICREVARWGGSVIGVDRNDPTGGTAAGLAGFFRADLSGAAAIDSLVETLPAGADGLVNCAGLPPTAPAEQVLRVNLVGLKHLTQRLVGKLADGASIVNLASLAGFGWPQAVDQIKAAATLDFDGVAAFVAEHKVGNEGGRSYFFTKEALIVWTMQNRWTWRDRGIRMNSVSPGPVDTPILPDFIETLGERAEEDMRVMDRPGRPADIAPVVAFLLSDGAGWIRGTNIPADGGMSSHILCGMHGFE